MGCGSGKVSVFESLNIEFHQLMSPIDKQILFVGEAFESSVNKLKTYVKGVEEYRHALVDERDRLSLITGSCSYKTDFLHMKSIFLSMAWKFSTDNNGKYETVVMTSESLDHDLQLTDYTYTKEALEALKSLLDYIIRVKKLRDKEAELLEESNEMEKIVLLFEKEQKLKNSTRLMEYNVKNTRNALAIIPDLAKLRLSIISQNEEAQLYIRLESTVSNIREKGILAYYNKLAEPYKIVWFLLADEERFDDEKEGYYRLLEIIVNKKQIRANYSKTGFQIDK